MKPSKVASSILSMLLLASGVSVAGTQETVVVNSWGGPYEKLHKQIIFEPFEKAHNVKIKVVTVYSADAR